MVNFIILKNKDLITNIFFQVGLKKKLMGSNNRIVNLWNVKLIRGAKN